MTQPVTYIPRKEHLGDFVKPGHGSSSAAQLVGFNESYDAVYASGAALVAAVTPVYKQSYTWRSANFFTGANVNLASYVTPVRDAVGAIVSALELVRAVLGVLDTLLSLGTNILKVIIDRILELFTSVVNLLNPTGSVHALVIPPKVGNIGVLPDTSIDVQKDSLKVQEYKRAEKTRQDFIGYTNTLSTKLPAAIGIDVSRLLAAQASSLTGYRYLLDTLRYKLDDTADLARPNLQAYSYTAGIGLFLGTNALNQFMDVWGKVNAIFSRGVETKDLAFKEAPPEPAITANRIPKVNALGTSRLMSAGEFSPTQWAVTVRPTNPSSLVIKSGVSYEFKLRVVYVNASSSSTDTSSFRAQIIGLLSDSLAVAAASEYGVLGSIPRYVTMREVDSNFSIERTDDLPEKLEPGSYNMVAIDYYNIKGAEDKCLYLASKSVRFTVPKVEDVRGLITLSGRGLPLAGPGSKDPMWFGASGAIHLLPEAVGLIVSFADSFKDLLSALLDDALSWIRTLLTNLATLIEGWSRLLRKLDEMIELLELLSSLTSGVGISVMSFAGQGDADALYQMFSDYLSPDKSSSSTNSVSTSGESFDEPSRLRAFSEAVKDSVSSALVRDGASNLDSVGSAYQVTSLRRDVQDRELARLFGDIDPQIPAVSGALGTSYNSSPIITEEMTSAGIVLLAHSPVGKDLAGLITLFDLLFGSDENATPKTQADILADNSLSVDIQTETISQGITGTGSEAPLFTADMKLTDDPGNSPFDFCP